MKPSFASGLSEADAAYESPYGKIGSHWKKQDGKLTWNIEIPANASALVYIPAKNENDIMESGTAALKVGGIKFMRMESGNAVFTVGSGQYQFELAIK